MASASDMMAAVAAGDSEGVSALLAEDPSLVNSRGEDGVSAVLLARYRFDRATMDALLAADPDLDIFEGAALGRIDRVRAALDDDPLAVRAFSPDGFTALHLAAFFGPPEAVQALLDAGADPHAVAANPMKVQPLHSAAAARNLEASRMLLEAGADPNAAQQEGFRPLDAATQNGDDALRELLLAHGADPGQARL